MHFRSTAGPIAVMFFLPMVANSHPPARPFPQHFRYTPGSIKPTNHTQAQLDDSTASFYDQWKARYLRGDCGPGQYYVWFDEQSSNNTICVSEGQGYGMIIAAHMASHDPNARGYFLNGRDIPGNNYDAPSFIGPFAIGAMVDSGNQSWLNDTYDHLLSMRSGDFLYFDNTLKVLSMIVLSGNWWDPFAIRLSAEDYGTESVE